MKHITVTGCDNCPYGNKEWEDVYVRPKVLYGCLDLQCDIETYYESRTFHPDCELDNYENPKE